MADSTNISMKIKYILKNKLREKYLFSKIYHVANANKPNLI